MHRRVRLLVLTSAVLAASTAVGTLGARAQVDLPTSTTTSTSAPPPSTTTTTQPQVTPTTSPPTTPPPTNPPPTQAPAPQPPTSNPPTTEAPVDGGGEGPADDHAHDGAIPSHYQSLVSLLRRSPANNTRKLLDALAPLQDFGVTPDDAIAMAFGRFPVGGYATFVDDWWFPRSSPPFHLHQGTDIFAASGTPVRSPANGILTRSNGGLGGLSAKVTEPDGTYHYLAHLSAIIPEQVEGQQVTIGERIGYVGDTGNAAGGAPHVHYEIHMPPAKNPYLYPPAPPEPKPVPRAKGRKGRTAAPAPAPKPQPVIIGNLADPALYGRGALPANNPKPFLDQWINEALVNVPALIARLEAGRPRAIVATGLTRRFTEGGAFAAPALPPRSQLLWASSANPSGGTLRLAEAEVSSVAGELDWAVLAKREEERALAEAEAERWRDAMLDPVTPPALRPFL